MTMDHKIRNSLHKKYFMRLNALLSKPEINIKGFM